MCTLLALKKDSDRADVMGECCGSAAFKDLRKDPWIFGLPAFFFLELCETLNGEKPMDL